MSLFTGVYLGLANIASFAILPSYPSTVLGTIAAVVSNNLTTYALLQRDTFIVPAWSIIVASGITVLCARSLTPTSPLEVVPYALTYLTLVTVPYLCIRRLCKVRKEKVSVGEVPLVEITEKPSQVTVDVIPGSPKIEDEYDHLTSEETLLLP